jgi:hypothetical protein
MRKPQQAGVQAQASRGIGSCSVFIIADDRATRVGQLHADLMAAPRFGRHFDQRQGVKLLNHPVTSHRVPRAVAGGRDIDLQRITLVQVAPQHTGVRRRLALHDSQVTLFHLRPLRLQFAFRSLRLGEHHQPGRFPVQSMHDPYPLRATTLTATHVVHQEGIRRLLSLAFAGHAQQVLRLVDHDQRRVLIQHLQAARQQAFGQHVPFGVNHHHVAGLQRVTGARDGHSVDMNRRVLDPLPNGRLLRQRMTSSKELQQCRRLFHRVGCHHKTLSP